MSTQSVIDSINESRADLFVASLGAKKGQEWLVKNHHRLRIPVRSHLGAAINFQAGILKRAPLWVRKFGFEWLWRIKEEPYLWRRYWADGQVLITLMFKSVLPLVWNAHWRRFKPSEKNAFVIRALRRDDSTEIVLKGEATANAVMDATPYFQDALMAKKPVNIDVSGISIIDMRFFGLLLMLRKRLVRNGLTLRFGGITAQARKSFRLNRFEFLLLTQQVPSGTLESED